MDKLAAMLAAVLAWGFRRGLTPEQVVTAQSLAWYAQTSYDGPELPPSHWAQIGVRKVLAGRDLPGCGTGECDALHHVLQGAGMGGLVDKEPGPDTLAAHRELLERILSEVSEIKRQVAELRIAGESNLAIAAHLGITPGRASQIAREIAERFRDG